MERCLHLVACGNAERRQVPGTFQPDVQQVIRAAISEMREKFKYVEKELQRGGEGSRNNLPQLDLDLSSFQVHLAQTDVVLLGPEQTNSLLSNSKPTDTGH